MLKAQHANVNDQDSTNRCLLEMEDGHSDDDILYSSSSSEEEAASMASGRPGVLQEMFSSLRLEPKAPPTIGVKVSVEQDWETLFALPDSPENIELDAGGGIIAATRTKLVERLTTIVGNTVSE